MGYRHWAFQELFRTESDPKMHRVQLGVKLRHYLGLSGPKRKLGDIYLRNRDRDEVPFSVIELIKGALN
jgi:hypothetical protein